MPSDGKLVSSSFLLLNVVSETFERSPLWLVECWSIGDLSPGLVDDPELPRENDSRTLPGNEMVRLTNVDTQQ